MSTILMSKNDLTSTPILVQHLNIRLMLLLVVLWIYSSSLSFVRPTKKGFESLYIVHILSAIERLITSFQRQIQHLNVA